MIAQNGRIDGEQGQRMEVAIEHLPHSGLSGRIAKLVCKGRSVGFTISSLYCIDRSSFTPLVFLVLDVDGDRAGEAGRRHAQKKSIHAQSKVSRVMHHCRAADPAEAQDVDAVLTQQWPEG